MIKITCTFQGSRKSLPIRNNNNNKNRSFRYIGCVNRYTILIYMKYMYIQISNFNWMEKRIIDDVLSLYNSEFGDFVDRIYPIELGYHRYVCFIPWPTPRHWQLGPVKNETLRQKISFQFSNGELSISM